MPNLREPLVLPHVIESSFIRLECHVLPMQQIIPFPIRAGPRGGVGCPCLPPCHSRIIMGEAAFITTSTTTVWASQVGPSQVELGVDVEVGATSS